MHRLVCVVVIGALAVAVSVVGAGPAVAAKGGNNDTAKLCQKGGWKALVSQTRDPFANQGDCVNDGAQGLGVAPLAGQAACANIGGTFSFGGSDEIVWTCKYSAPPNPMMPQELVTRARPTAAAAARASHRTRWSASPTRSAFAMASDGPLGPRTRPSRLGTIQPHGGGANASPPAAMPEPGP